MQQRVTAVLVVRSGVEYLERTLVALEDQTRPPDAVIAVDAGSTDGSRDILAAFDAASLVSTAAETSFAQAAAIAVDSTSESAPEPPATELMDDATAGASAGGSSPDDAATDGASPDGASPDGATDGAKTGEDSAEWLWLLAHDSAPDQDALAALLRAVEIAPSVAVAGPKLMQWQNSEVIAEFGESLTRLGESVSLVDGELDQAQHDVQNDVLGVAAAGMLVRREVWTQLGGFDGGLPSTDAGLDFSVRARLAGHRVILVPDARVASAGGPQHFGERSVTESRRLRIARSAQLHRRLVYCLPLLLPLHWLCLVPLAVARSIGHLVAKRPGSIPAEFAAAFGVAFGRTYVARARRSLALTRKVGWGAVAPLRLTRRQAAEYRLLRRERDDDQLEQDRLARERRERERLGTARVAPLFRPEPVGFVVGGGLWVTVAAAIVGLVAFGGLIGAEAVTGGGLLPLPDEAGALWRQVGYGWRDIGTGFVGAADPFSAVLAVLGSLTFWHPSTAIIALYVCAPPLAAVTAWFCARRFSDRHWVPTLAGAVWAVAPPFLSSLNTGHLGAAIAHILLPALVLAAVRGARSWSSAAGAALLFAGVAASAPVLTPALVVLLLAWIVARPRSVLRLGMILLPAAVLFAPLVAEQVSRGFPLGLLADPGFQVAGARDAATVSGVQLAIGSASGGSDGWSDLLVRLELPAEGGLFVAVALLLPLAVLAGMCLFARSTRRAIPALVVTLVGFATAVVASRLDLSFVGVDPVTVWPGSGLSLYWLGLAGGAVVALDALGRAAVGSAVLAGVASALLAVPLVAAGLLGTSNVQPGTGRILPAIVDAEAAIEAETGTLVLVPEQENGISVELERGPGALLTDQSTLDATSPGSSDQGDRLATLAGNLASRSGYDFAAGIDQLGIGFVVLMEPTDDSAPVFARTAEAINANPLLVPAGQTATGLLWTYSSESTGLTSGPGNLGTPTGVAVIAVQATVIGLIALLAVPSTRRRRRYTERGGESVAQSAAVADD